MIRVVIAAVLIIGVLGGCSVSPNPEADKALHSAQLCAGQEKAAESFERDKPVTTGSPVAVVLGDSYTQGTGVSDVRNDGWATQFGRLEGWTTFVNGTGGTGFTSAGPCLNQQFFTRVPAVLEYDPQIVVVQGGLNDTTADPGRLSLAVDDLMRRMSSVKRVIVVGPTAAPAFPRAAMVDQVLRARTLANGRDYVSTQGGKFEFLPDETHLTAAGYRAFAEYVAGQLGPRS